MEEKRDGCVECMRYIFVMLNATFLLAGVVLTLLGVWFYAVPANRNLLVIVYETSHQSQLEVLMLLVICVGSGVCFTAIVSCCAAFSQSRCLLITILLSIGFLFLTELFITGIGVLYAGVLKSGINDRMIQTLATNYTGDGGLNSESVAWREVQKAFSCCGIDTAEGYQNHTNVLYKSLTGSLWYRTRSNDSEEEWPASCCSVPRNGQANGSVSCTEVKGSYLNEAGCQEKTQAFVQAHLMTIVGISIFILSLHVISAVLCYKLYKDALSPQNLVSPMAPLASRKGYDQFGNATFAPQAHGHR